MLTEGLHTQAGTGGVSKRRGGTNFKISMNPETLFSLPEIVTAITVNIKAILYGFL